MRGAVAVLAIAFLAAGNIPAQVHIRENAAISPVIPRNVQGEGINNHIIRFEFYWDSSPRGRVDYYNAYGYGFQCPVNATTNETSSSYIVTIYSPPAQYYFFDAYILIAHCTDNMLAHYSWNLYYDDSLVTSGSGNCRLKGDCYVPGLQWALCSSNMMHTASFFPPYHSTFDFSLGTSQLRSGDSTWMGLGILDDGCSSCSWSEHTDPLTITVTSGSQCVSFHRRDSHTGYETKLGPIINVMGDKIGEYSLVADGAVPDPIGGWVTVEAVSNGIMRRDSVQVLPPFGRFEVYAVPDTIEHTEMAIVHVQAKDIYDQDIDYDGRVRISDIPTGYGELGYYLPTVAGRKTADVRTEQAASVLQNKSMSAVVKLDRSESELLDIDYSYANAGMLFYSADGIAPDTNTTITFNVSAVDDESAIGTGGVVIRAGTQIAIDIPSPAEVWPTLNPASGGNPKERNVKYLTVCVTRKGRPAANYHVRIQASMILPSGGHSHTNQPPLDEMGEFEDYVNHVDANGVITTTTGANGVINLAYTTPEFAGNVQVTATSTSENVKAVDSICVKVPDLVPMNGGAHLITYTSPAAAKRHALTDSDYGTPSTNASILGVIKLYADEYGMENDIYLAAIDMSLLWGGLFDVNGDWNPPHSFHRVGKSVDFSKWYRDDAGNVVAVDIFVDGKLWVTTNLVDEVTLDSYFKQAGFTRMERRIGKIHYESSN